jgi:NADPH:quinone reductase-like Zn-dependent oxidoreductase
VLVHPASGGVGSAIAQLVPLLGGVSISRLWATAPHRASAGLRRVLDLITEGRLDIAITEVGSLADVPAVHQLLAEGRGDGKYVVRMIASSAGRLPGRFPSPRWAASVPLSY